jgi:hypothetical protein
MTISWPATLPQYVQQAGYGESLPDQTIESQVDAGPPKSRRRFTKNARQVQATIWCDAAQRAAFELFHADTLQGGVLPFLWVNPITQVAALYRFRRPPPALTAFAGGHIAIAMNLLQLAQYTTFRFDVTGAPITFDSTLISFDQANSY